MKNKAATLTVPSSRLRTFDLVKNGNSYQNNYDEYYDAAICRSILKKNDLNKVSRVLYYKLKSDRSNTQTKSTEIRPPV